MAFALDAIAIAGQAIIGRYLGADDAEGARSGSGRRMVQWGIATGVVLGHPRRGLPAALHPLCSPATSAVHPHPSSPALLVVAVSQPIAGVVFVLDGVLMGAGDRPLFGHGDARDAGGLRCLSPCSFP